MRRAHKLAALALACVALIAVPRVDAATSAPTPAQIKAAIRSATRSKLLWATINSCDSRGNRTVGVRGEMPALGFPAHLLMIVRVQEWSAGARRYVAVKGTWKLGGSIFTSGSVQEGVRLRWSGQVKLTAKIDFEWFRDGRRLGSTTRSTTAGHARADGSDYSAGTCSIS